jgi:hypothetical protein
MQGQTSRGINTHTSWQCYGFQWWPINFLHISQEYEENSLRATKSQTPGMETAKRITFYARISVTIIRILPHQINFLIYFPHQTWIGQYCTSLFHADRLCCLARYRVHFYFENCTSRNETLATGFHKLIQPKRSHAQVLQYFRRLSYTFSPAPAFVFR